MMVDIDELLSVRGLALQLAIIAAIAGAWLGFDYDPLLRLFLSISLAALLLAVIVWLTNQV